MKRGQTPFPALRCVTLACLMLAMGGAAQAQMPGCLRFEAQRTLSCGELHGGAPIATPTAQYASWKGVSRGGQRSMTYLVFAGVDRRREPLFQRDGVGVSRTAEEWLVLSTGVFFFDSADASDPHASRASDRSRRLTPPITIRLRGDSGGNFLFRGFAYFNAKEVRFVGSPMAGVETTVRHASEPFFDLGIDLDHDGVICDERGPGACCPDSPDGPGELTRCNEYVTVTNLRWDVELDDGCDPRVTACASDGPLAGESWPPAGHGWDAFVAMHEEHADEGLDPRLLPMLAHEPFLAWEAITPGYDREEVDVVTPLCVQGVIYNEGRVVLGDGFTASGAVLASGGVTLERGAEITWSSDFSRPKFPPTEWKGLPDGCR